MAAEIFYDADADLKLLENKKLRFSVTVPKATHMRRTCGIVVVR